MEPIHFLPVDWCIVWLAVLVVMCTVKVLYVFSGCLVCDSQIFFSVLHFPLFSFHSFIPSSIHVFISPPCSVTTLLHFSPNLSLLLFSFFLSPPLTPLVIMVSSCYDKPRLNLFLSPLRQVLDIHQLFLCMCVCVSVTVLVASVCMHIFCMCAQLSFHSNWSIKIINGSKSCLLQGVVSDVSEMDKVTARTEFL